MDNQISKIDRGCTLYGPTATVPSTFTGSVCYEGTPCVTRDVTSGSQSPNSANDVFSLLVRNSSATTLYAGDVVVWDSAYIGKRVGRKCRVTGELVAGVVDDKLDSNGVRANDIFHLIVEGKCLASTTTVTGDITNGIAAGDWLMASTGATSQADAAGKFEPVPTAYTITQTTDGTMGKYLLNYFAQAVSTVTATETDTLKMIRLVRR